MEQDDYNKTRIDSRERCRTQCFQQGDIIAECYEFVCDLGRGGMGNVYLCCDLSSNSRKMMALKTVPEVLGNNKEAMEALQHEYDNMYKLIYDDIVVVRRLVRDAFRYYIVMDYAEGETLEAYLRQHPRPGLAITLDVVRRMAKALDYAHGKNMIHCDVKPGNVIVQIDDDETVKSVKLLDFGLSVQIRKSFTQITGKIKGGTPAYMSPEQWKPDKFKEPSFRSDQYSLAALTYEMLDGRFPFAGNIHNMDIFETAVCKYKPAEINSLPEYMNEALQKALSKFPKDRFENCMAFIEALEGKGTTTQPPSETVKRSSHSDVEEHLPPLSDGFKSINKEIFEKYRAMLGESAKYHEGNGNQKLAEVFHNAQSKLRDLLKLSDNHSPILAFVELSKSGKSTLMSALFGMEITKSSVPVEYRYSREFEGNADFAGTLVADTQTFENAEELLSFIDNSQDASALSIKMPSDLLKEGLVIADAPTFGITGAGDVFQEENVRECIAQATYVFWVVSSKRGIMPNDRIFYDRFLKGHCENIVVNCVDECSLAERREFERKNRENLGARAIWHFVDAKSAYKGKTSGNADLVHKSGIATLERKIMELAPTEQKLNAALMQFFDNIDRYWRHTTRERFFVEHQRRELELMLQRQPSSEMIKKMISSISRNA